MEDEVRHEYTLLFQFIPDRKTLPEMVERKDNESWGGEHLCELHVHTNVDLS